MKREDYKTGEKAVPAEWYALPKTRRQAKAIGAKHFFTGAPCEHGHIDRRYTSSGGCMACARAADLKRYSKKKPDWADRIAATSSNPTSKWIKERSGSPPRAIHVEATEDAHGHVKVLWAAIASTQDELDLIVQHRRALRRKGLPIPNDLA